ncbi:class I SAM-dependent methyltransferase [Aliigemmobacter aestuarii]|nr:class I SAM-dependent methyltransferase [Gemmobacter aestuarii]
MSKTLEEILGLARATGWDDMPTDHADLIGTTFAKNSIDRAAVPFLYGLTRAISPRRAIEVGLGSGASATTFALAARPTLAAYDIMDPYQSSGFGDRGLNALRKALADSACALDFHEEMSHVVLPRLLAAGKRYDYAMIDASHKFDATLIEVFYIDLMLVTGGIMVLDDRAWPMVGAVIEFMKTNYAHLTVDTSDARLTVVQKIGPDRRKWFDYWHFDPPRSAQMEAKIEEYRRASAAKPGS